MFQEIINTAITTGGTVFGGAVRDIVRKDMMCRAYYDAGFKKDTFEDSSVSPDTVDRLLVPNDIDVHFKDRRDYHTFRSQLKSLFYETRVQSISNLYTTGPGVHHIKLVAILRLDPVHIIRSIKLPGQSMARKMFSGPISQWAESLPDIHATPIYIDVLISKTLAPPFSDLDFRCNGLVMDSDGIHLCNDLSVALTPIQKSQELVSVMDEIRKKIAISVHLKGPRWDKMEAKGWYLKSTNLEVKRDSFSSECIVCLQNIPNNEGVYKLRCCPATYHIGCLSRQITYPITGICDSHKCPYCRQSCILTTQEIHVFGATIVNF